MTRKNLSIILCFALLISSFIQLSAQKTTQMDTVSLRLMARYYGDSAVLRWGFDKAFAWTEVDKVGFIIERVELDETNAPLSSAYQKVATVKSWRLDEFKTRAPRTDTMAMVAAQCLHGKSFSANVNGQNTTDDLKSAAANAENRFRYAQIAADFSPIAAEGLGWRWVDKYIKQNRKYIYRIHSPIDKSLFFRIDTTGFILPTNKVSDLETPQGFHIERGEHTATLIWQHTRDYTAYLIEKSEDGKTFRAATKTPYITFKDKKEFEVFYTDSLKENYKNYYYRVRGLNPFGEKSTWSEPQILRGRDLTPPPTPEFTKATIERVSLKVNLEWTTPFDALRTDLKGFHIAYAKDLDHPFLKITKTLLPVMVKQYSLTWNKSQNSGYYKVVAVDTAGNEAASHFKYVFLNDLDPPSKPVGLTGKIDTSGKVIISWAKPIETDVKGYVVQFANALNHPFVGRSKGIVEDTVFADSITLHTLTEKMYYRIAAVDLNENVSAFSDVLTLKKPDIIKPVPPNFKDYRATDSTIYLAWYPSSSSDAVKQRLYRKDTACNACPWEMIAEFDNSKNTFLDRPPTANLYAYAIEAQDDDGLYSLRNEPILLKCIDDRKLKATPKLSADFDEKTKSVILKWQFSTTPKINDFNINYILYRAIADAPLQQIKTIRGEILNFTDTKVILGTQYRYAIKAIADNERESKLSDAVQIKAK